MAASLRRLPGVFAPVLTPFLRGRVDTGLGAFRLQPRLLRLLLSFRSDQIDQRAKPRLTRCALPRTGASLRTASGCDGTAQV
jgi:hypothetical protein